MNLPVFDDTYAVYDVCCTQCGNVTALLPGEDAGNVLCSVCIFAHDMAYATGKVVQAREQEQNR